MPSLTLRLVPVLLVGACSARSGLTSDAALPETGVDHTEAGEEIRPDSSTTGDADAYEATNLTDGSLERDPTFEPWWYPQCADAGSECKSDKCVVPQLYVGPGQCGPFEK